MKYDNVTGKRTRRKQIEKLRRVKTNQIKLQVFVSATYEDLREERQAAVEAIIVVQNVGNIDQVTTAILLELDGIFDKDEMSLKRWVKNDSRILRVSNEEIKKKYEMEIKEECKKEIERKYKEKFSVSYLKTREKIENQLKPLENMFKDTSQIDIVTATGIRLLHGYEDRIKDILKDDGEMRVVIFDPKTEAFNEHISNKLDSIQNLKDSSMEARKGWLEFVENYSKIKLKYTDICLPYNILYVRKKGEEDYIKIDLYSVNTEVNQRPCMYINALIKCFLSFKINLGKYGEGVEKYKEDNDE